MPATLGSVDAPLLLLGASTTEPSLWINVGAVGTLTINGETFSDNGWTLLAQIYNFPATFSGDPLNGNLVYQTLTDPTLSAVIAKLAQPASNGGLQKWNAAFYRMFTA